MSGGVVAVVVVLNTALSAVALWIACGAERRANEISEQLDVARGPIAPALECDCPACHRVPEYLDDDSDLLVDDEPEPVTQQPIPQQSATVPTNHAIDAAWARMMADADAYIASIRQAES